MTYVFNTHLRGAIQKELEKLGTFNYESEENDPAVLIKILQEIKNLCDSYERNPEVSAQARMDFWKELYQSLGLIPGVNESFLAEIQCYLYEASQEFRKSWSTQDLFEDRRQHFLSASRITLNEQKRMYAVAARLGKESFFDKGSFFYSRPSRQSLLEEFIEDLEEFSEYYHDSLGEKDKGSILEVFRILANYKEILRLCKKNQLLSNTSTLMNLVEKRLDDVVFITLKKLHQLKTGESLLLPYDYSIEKKILAALIEIKRIEEASFRLTYINPSAPYYPESTLDDEPHAICYTDVTMSDLANGLARNILVSMFQRAGDRVSLHRLFQNSPLQESSVKHHKRTQGLCFYTSLQSWLSTQVRKPVFEVYSLFIIHKTLNIYTLQVQNVPQVEITENDFSALYELKRILNLELSQRKAALYNRNTRLLFFIQDQYTAWKKLGGSSTDVNFLDFYQNVLNSCSEGESRYILCENKSQTLWQWFPMAKAVYQLFFAPKEPAVPVKMARIARLIYEAEADFNFIEAGCCTSYLAEQRNFEFEEGTLSTSPFEMR